MEVSGQFHARDNSPQYPLGRSMCGPQSQFGPGGEGKYSHRCPCRESIPIPLARRLVTILTELPRFHLNCKAYNECVFIHSDATVITNCGLDYTLGFDLLQQTNEVFP
jgi:hypothetical protein